MIKKIFFLTSLVCLTTVQFMLAQNSSSSPYSRFGIGDLQFSGFSRNLGMDGLGVGISGGYYLNPLNPASYGSMLYTTYEGGVNLQLNELSTSIQKQRNNTAGLSYFSFGFPVKSKKWGLGFGLLPYSNVGYSIDDPRSSDLDQRELHSYEGSGGLNQFHMTTGFTLAKNLSLGLTASYLFGVINQDRIISFDNSVYFNTRVQNSTSIGWFNYNAGLQYTFDSLRIAPSDSVILLDKLKKAASDSLEILNDSIRNTKDEITLTSLKTAATAQEEEFTRLNTIKNGIQKKHTRGDWSLSLGLTVSPSAELRARNSTLAYSFKYYDNFSRDQVIVRDTIQNTEGERGKVKLPLNMGLGISMKKGTNWLIGTDFSLQNWEDFSWFGTSDSLANSWKVGAGAQYTPNERALKSYWKQIQYRAGIHYARSFLQLRSSQLEETGVSIGAGFPIRRAGTILSLAVQAGQRGTVENNLIREKYMRFTLGFTLNDRWFVKPKFD